MNFFRNNPNSLARVHDHETNVQEIKGSYNIRQTEIQAEAACKMNRERIMGDICIAHIQENGAMQRLLIQQQAATLTGERVWQQTNHDRLLERLDKAIANGNNEAILSLAQSMRAYADNSAKLASMQASSLHFPQMPQSEFTPNSFGAA